MGLIEIARRSVFFAFFAFASVATFVSGWQLDKIEGKQTQGVAGIELYRVAEAKRDLVKALERDAMSDHAPLVKTLVSRAPLDELPYERALVLASETGDLRGANKFAKRVLSLQPRSLAAHLHLMHVASLEQDFSTLFYHYERLVELRSLNQDLLASALVGVFRANRDWAPLLEHVRKHPGQNRPIVKLLMREQISPEDLEPLVESFPEFQTQYLNMLVAERNFVHAHEAWLRFSKIDRERSSNWPFNDQFEPRNEPQPFNWVIDNSRAELQEQGGLHITYFGRGRAILATQLMLVTPGEYTLETLVNGRVPKRAGKFAWYMACYEDGAKIMELPIVLSRISHTESFQGTVVIPVIACSVQELELRVYPGEFPQMSQLQVLSVKLMPAAE